MSPKSRISNLDANDIIGGGTRNNDEDFDNDNVAPNLATVSTRIFAILDPTRRRLPESGAAVGQKKLKLK